MLLLSNYYEICKFIYLFNMQDEYIMLFRTDVSQNLTLSMNGTEIIFFMNNFSACIEKLGRKLSNCVACGRMRKR